MWSPLRGSLIQDLLGFVGVLTFQFFGCFGCTVILRSNLGLGHLHLFTLGQPVMIRGGGGDCWSCDNDYSYSDYVAMTTDRRTRG